MILSLARGSWMNTFYGNLELLDAEAAAYFALLPSDLGKSANFSNELRRQKIKWPPDEDLRRHRSARNEAWVCRRA